VKIFLLSFLILTISSYPQKNQLLLEDIFSTDKYVAEEVENIQWLPDGSAFTYTENNKTYNLLDIYNHNVESGENVLIVAGTELKFDGKQIKMSDYSWTGDGKYLLIEGPEKEIWRHSRQAPFYLYNVELKTITAVGNNDPNLRNVKLSPDGSKVGFVRSNNIYMADLSTGKENQITTDGNAHILNGEIDCAYEEEFTISDGWQWSPDGKKIAFWRFDQTRVTEF